jgi:hypothetical protein
MTRANYNTIPSLVADLDPWTQNSAHASRNGEHYVVVSYATPIAKFDGHAWTVATRRYSRTTSRLQRAVNDGIARHGGPVTEVDTL